MCDQPHPLAVADALKRCTVGELDGAVATLLELHTKGYSTMDVIGTLFRVAKGMDDADLPEALKLAYIREIGFAHMRAGDGITSALQLAGLVAKLCRVAAEMRRR